MEKEAAAIKSLVLENEEEKLNQASTEAETVKNEVAASGAKPKVSYVSS